MKHFDLKNPTAWELIVDGEVLELDAPSGVRRFSMTVNAEGVAAVYVRPRDGDYVLVGASDGMFTVTASVGDKWQVKVVSDDAVFILPQAGSQRVRQIGHTKHTSIQPRGARDPNLDKIMHYVRLRDLAHEQKLDEQMRGLRDELTEANAKLLKRQDEDDKARMAANNEGGTPDASAQSSAEAGASE